MVDSEELSNRRDVGYTNVKLSVYDLLGAHPNTVFVVGRVKTAHDAVVRASFTTIAAQKQENTKVTFFCTDTSTGRAYFGTYIVTTGEFTFRRMTPWR